MYGCCSTECATIIHLKKSKPFERNKKNKIFKKGKSDKLLFKMQNPLYSDLTELAKRKPVAKKSGEN
jgi:hypothetical protein